MVPLPSWPSPSAPAPAPDAKSSGGRGRVAGAAGKKIHKLVNTEDTALRDSGLVRDCWNLIKEGMTVEKYRESAADSGHALATLRTFVAKGYVELIEKA